MIIGFDIDGVINDEASFLIDYGTKYAYDRNMDYIIDTSKNGTHNIYNWPSSINDDFWEQYYFTYLTTTKYIRQFSKEILSKVHEKHKIIFITARDTHNTSLSQEDVETMTKEWLNKNQFEYDQLVFTKNKYDYVKSHGINIMVEDNPDTITEMSKEIDVLCYHTAYNDYIEGEKIFCVNSWFEIYKLISCYT